MGRHDMEGIRGQAPFSKSGGMERISPICIAFRPAIRTTLMLKPIVTDLLPLADCFWRVIVFMERPYMEAFQGLALYLRSRRMARVSPTFTISPAMPQPELLLLLG